MSFYCLCREENIIETEDNQYVRDAPIKVYLGEKSMECIKTGAQQFLKDGSQHYPNVDVFRCNNCGARIARE